MTALGADLVVVDTIVYCDSHAQHETRALTDGHTAYAGGTGKGGVDHGTAYRDGASVRFTCQHPDRYDEPCGADLVVPLQDWTGDVQAVEFLSAYGQPVDQ